jgi:L-aminopeptidase/D-esterase-like protein
MLRREFNRTLLGLPLAAAVPSLYAQERDARERELALPPGGSITDVPGLKVGHYTLTERPTGCTVLLCEAGATAGVDVRGSAPGTRETDLLSPTNAVQTVNAILLSGGSAYGLDAAAGVMRWLEENHAGYKIGRLGTVLGVVPIVPAAILMDLGVGDFKIRPNAESGYKACVAASTAPVAEGNVGAGAGATVGKMFGPQFAMKAGLGTASVRIADTGLVVGALVAVNSVGDVVHPQSGKVVAGARSEDGRGFRDTMAAILDGYRVVAEPAANTCIGIVATNAAFTKTQMTKIAQMAHDGYARAINPVHTMADGDTIFAVSTGTSPVAADESAIGAVAATVMARAIVRAAMLATSLPAFNLPAYRDYAGRG